MQYIGADVKPIPSEKRRNRDRENDREQSGDENKNKHQMVRFKCNVRAERQKEFGSMQPVQCHNIKFK